MASTSQDHALYQMTQILEEDKESKEKFDNHLRKVVRLWPDEVWKSSPGGDVVLIHCHYYYDLMRNISYFMFKELVGMGPKRYCILYTKWHFEYIATVKIIFKFLPRQKMFVYPANAPVPSIEYHPDHEKVKLRVLYRQPSITREEFETYFGIVDPDHGSRLGR